MKIWQIILLILGFIAWFAYMLTEIYIFKVLMALMVVPILPQMIKDAIHDWKNSDIEKDSMTFDD